MRRKIIDYIKKKYKAEPEHLWRSYASHILHCRVMHQHGQNADVNWQDKQSRNVIEYNDKSSRPEIAELPMEEQRHPTITDLCSRKNNSHKFYLSKTAENRIDDFRWFFYTDHKGGDRGWKIRN